MATLTSSRNKSLLFIMMVLAFAPLTCAQTDHGSRRSSYRILVFVRNPDNSAAPAGVGVRLEVDGGGLMDVQSTDSAGRVTFHPTIPTGYTIIVHQPGYKDDTRHVDLTLTPTSSASLQLIPLLISENTVAPNGSARSSTISAGELGIPELARREFETGQKLLDEKHDAAGSIEHFNKAIKVYGNFPRAYTMLGLAYLQDHKLADSRTALEHAVQLDSTSGTAYVALGGCLNQLKDFPPAEKALLKAVELLPDSPEAHYELARAYWGMHRWQDAEPQASKAEKLQPNLTGVHVLMGNILLQKQDAPGALREFKEYLRLDPNGPMSEGVRAMVAKLAKSTATQ